MKDVFVLPGKVGKLTARHITLMAMTFALKFALGLIPGLNFGNMVQIGFGFIGTAFAGVILGPWYAMIVSMIYDLVEFMIAGSGTFFPGFTLSAGVAGLIYGYFLWRRDLRWYHVTLAVLSVTLIVNLGLNSIWVKLMFDKAWSVFMPMRVIKNLISFPINSLILSLIFTNSNFKRFIRKYEF